MKVFKVKIETTKFLVIDPNDSEAIEAWEHCMTEDGGWDIDAIQSELQEHGYGDLDSDSETITVTTLGEKEAKYYLGNQ